MDTLRNTLTSSLSLHLPFFQLTSKIIKLFKWFIHSPQFSCPSWFWFFFLLTHIICLLSFYLGYQHFLGKLKLFVSSSNWSVCLRSWAVIGVVMSTYLISCLQAALFKGYYLFCDPRLLCSEHDYTYLLIGTEATSLSFWPPRDLFQLPSTHASFLPSLEFTTDPWTFKAISSQLAPNVMPSHSLWHHSPPVPLLNFYISRFSVLSHCHFIILAKLHLALHTPLPQPHPYLFMHFAALLFILPHIFPKVPSPSKYSSILGLLPPWLWLPPPKIGVNQILISCLFLLRFTHPYGSSDP